MAAEQSTNKLKSHYELVGEFHDVNSHPVRIYPYINCFTDDLKLVPFRIKLMKEELDEFIDAYAKKDVVEMADALCDLSYVTNGAGLVLGLNLDQILAELYINIMTPNNLNTVDMNLCETKKEFIDDYILLLQKTLTTFCSAYEIHNISQMGNALAIMLLNTYDLGHGLNFNMDLMFREVHRSNMTKTCSNVEDAEASVKAYQSDPRYEKPAYKVKGKYFIIFNEADSKILKNYKWEQPNLKQFF